MKNTMWTITLLASLGAACVDAGALERDESGSARTTQAATTVSPALRDLLAHDYLPDADSVARAPWGGRDPARWQAEAIVANAASSRINAAWKDPELADVLVAIPTKLRDSGFRPYGDGQTNSDVTFPFWGGRRPPLVATLREYRDGSQTVELDFDVDLDLAQGAIEIAYETVTSRVKRAFVVSAASRAGHLVATFTPPAELQWNDPGQLTPIFVRPSPGFNDWFPVYFRMPRHRIDDFVASVPPSLRTFPDGKPLLDPENLRGTVNGVTPLQRALTHRFPAHRYNTSQLDGSGKPLPYVPPNVHAEFGPGGRPTAVGRGFTWVAERSTPFKVMYTGFDGRDEAGEAQHGVPSGSGWHAMGDTITLLNHEEDVPMLAGAGFTSPAVRFGLAPPSASYAYQLADVVVLRLLLPGEAFVTAATVFPSRDKDHQWYAIPVGPRGRGFLSEEWVHPTRPTGNNPRFE